MNKQLHGRIELLAQLEISRGQPSEQRAQTKVMKEHREMFRFEILAQLASALTVADEERIHIYDVVVAGCAGARRGGLHIHEPESQIRRKVIAMRFAPLRVRIHQRRDSGRKSGIRLWLLYERLEIPSELVMDGASEHRFLGGEVIVERALGDIGLGGDLLHGDRVEPISLEQAHRHAGEVIQRLEAFAVTAAERVECEHAYEEFGRRTILFIVHNSRSSADQHVQRTRRIKKCGNR